MQLLHSLISMVNHSGTLESYGGTSSYTLCLSCVCGLVSFPHHQHLRVSPVMTEVVRVVEGSRRQALRVTWEHGRLTHVVETQVQHADSLQAWGAAQFSHSKKS